ncbi:MAG: sigma-70 family RNA polymerase sigma factor, partial [Ruminococcus sp.]|nr:sigma-70 family RNA polymerase sigma factor [Ruminococcus sp.]
MNELQWRESVEAAKKGDKKAFENLYRETERAVYFTCLKLLANEDSAKDMMQDTYMTALDKLDTLDDGAKFPMWINRIAVNKCKNRLVKVKDDSLDEKIEQGSEFKDDDSFIPEEYVTDEAKRKIIMNIIDTVLSDVQRQTIILYYYDEMSLEEIAEVMDCPVKTVSSRLVSAREKIKEAVLIYEKANDDRLHMLVPVPILTRILLKEAQSVSVPDISPILMGSQFFNAAANAYASTTTVVAGGSKMVGGIITGKIVAAIAAGAIAVGGVTAAVVMSNKGSDDSSKSYTSVVLFDTSSSFSVSDTSSQADTS